MSLIVQTVFANLIDWLFKPVDNLCSQLLTGAFGGLVGSMSNDEWNVAITAANRIGWIMGFVNMALCIIGALQAAAKGSVADVIKSFALAVLAWPLTAVCISVMITMDGIVGQITNRILTVPLAGVGTSDRRLTGVPLSPRVRVDVMPEGIRPSGRKTRAGSLRLFFPTDSDGGHQCPVIPIPAVGRCPPHRSADCPQRV